MLKHMLIEGETVVPTPAAKQRVSHLSFGCSFELSLTGLALLVGLLLTLSSLLLSSLVLLLRPRLRLPGSCCSSFLRCCLVLGS